MNTQNEFENALIDVRKAYRLLYLYQRRVMDVVQFIGDSLSFNYDGGWSWFSNNTPKNGKGTLTNWSWDWLNMYLYEFHFKEKVIKNEKYLFSVFIVSDSGFYDSDCENELEIDDFESCETSTSKLIFLIGRNCWHPEFSGDFNAKSSKIFKKAHSESINKMNDKILLTKSFNLTEFNNMEASQASINAFIQFCNDNGIQDIENSF